MSVHLRLRSVPHGSLDLSPLRPDVLAVLDEVAIARLPLSLGRESASLGDFFEVRGGASDDVRIEGDLRGLRHLGAGMSEGRLLLEGDVGDGAGAEMSGGVLEIRGSTGHRLGGPRGGSARGMTGGLILVHGSVGDEAGGGLRRGTIAVAGSAGARTAFRMIAGTLIVGGDLGPHPGLLMRRGTLLAGGRLELLPTFRYACAYRPGFLPLLMRSLERQGFEPARRLATGHVRLFAGDFTELGRGEILQWTNET